MSGNGAGNNEPMFGPAKNLAGNGKVGGFDLANTTLHGALTRRRNTGLVGPRPDPRNGIAAEQYPPVKWAPFILNPGLLTAQSSDILINPRASHQSMASPRILCR
jgi:hypothetical protein